VFAKNLAIANYTIRKVSVRAYSHSELTENLEVIFWTCAYDEAVLNVGVPIFVLGFDSILYYNAPWSGFSILFNDLW
jgi:hypothetical protein